MSKGDPREPIDLSPPGAKDYANRIAAAKNGHVPVGGAPMPNIPRLDQPPPGAPRDRSAGVQQSHDQQGATQGMMRAMSPQQYDQAVRAGQVIPGVGGAYMANQPPGSVPTDTQPQTPPMEMRGPDGKPVNPPRDEGGLRPETMKQLEEVAAANSEEGKKAAEEKKKSDDDDFDYAQLGLATKDIISNKERREAIEAKIKDELNFEDLIVHQEIRQEVPILKSFKPTFRTPSGNEDLFVKRLISDEEGSDRYVMDKYASMGVCCGLYAINGRPLPSHLDKDGYPDKELFDAKMKVILKYPLVLLADLSANFTWFTERVQRLLALDKVKDF